MKPLSPLLIPPVETQEHRNGIRPSHPLIQSKWRYVNRAIRGKAEVEDVVQALGLLTLESCFLHNPKAPKRNRYSSHRITMRILRRAIRVAIRASKSFVGSIEDRKLLKDHARVEESIEKDLRLETASPSTWTGNSSATPRVQRILKEYSVLNIEDKCFFAEVVSRAARMAVERGHVKPTTTVLNYADRFLKSVLNVKGST